MNTIYDDATPEELKSLNDKCAICREEMINAKKLPCSHMFHLRCLQSWMKYKQICPICRSSLLRTDLENSQDSDDATNFNNLATEQLLGRQNNNNRILRRPFAGFLFRGPLRRENSLQGDVIFRFDSRHLSRWLPSFSIELHQTFSVARGSHRDNNQPVGNNSQLDQMVNQVHEIFPQLPREMITNDLNQTQNVQLTISNILNGHIQQRRPINDSPDQSGDSHARTPQNHTNPPHNLNIRNTVNSSLNTQGNIINGQTNVDNFNRILQDSSPENTAQNQSTSNNLQYSSISADPSISRHFGENIRRQSNQNIDNCDEKEKSEIINDRLNESSSNIRKRLKFRSEETDLNE